jgi:hypothetical protein
VSFPKHLGEKFGLVDRISRYRLKLNLLTPLLKNGGNAFLHL